MNWDKPRGRDEITKAIVAAAVPLIAERGVRDVSFRDIAKAAGVQHSLITRHFGTKNALLERIGKSLGESLFHSARGDGESFVDVWDRILREQRTQLRAIVRILLDTEAKQDVPSSGVHRMEETVRWFRDKLEVTEGPFDASLAIYLTLSFLLGTEVFGDHIQRMLQLTDQQFGDLRPRAIRALLDGLAGAHVPSI